MRDATSQHLPREIRTPRLLLRAVAVDDAADQADAVTASLADLKAWMPWAQEPQTIEQAAEGLVGGAVSFDVGKEFNWTIRDRASEAFVGRVSVFAVDWRIPKGEIGYWLSSSQTGLGYMREAVSAVVDTAEGAGFRRLEIRCDARNIRSAHVAERLGFTRDALLRNDDVSAEDPSVLRDTVVLSRTR